MILTIVVGYLSTYIDWPEGYAVHLNGTESEHSWGWFAYFISQYIIGFIMVGGYLLLDIPLIDRVVATTYLIFDGIGLFSYLWMGWPEPKLLIISAFCVTASLYLILSIWSSE